jgi:hypothetical protein
LALDTLDYLHSINAINNELAASYRTAAISVGEAAVRDGYDHKHGGIFQNGSASDGHVNTDKVWWVQAEAMQALWKLHQHHEEISSGSSGMYLQMLADTVRFMKEHVTDTQGPGEQFWQVRAVGLTVHVCIGPWCGSALQCTAASARFLLEAGGSIAILKLPASQPAASKFDLQCYLALLSLSLAQYYCDGALGWSHFRNLDHVVQPGQCLL